MSTLSDFAAKHWIAGGIGVSLLWFAAGRQSLSNRTPDAAVLWQSVAVIISLIVCGWTIVEGMAWSRRGNRAGLFRGTLDPTLYAQK